MALQGNLKDFQLPEILQLISTQQKTGILKIDAPGKSYGIFVSRGYIQLVDENPDELGIHFVTYLSKCGVVQRRLVKEIIKRSRSTSESAIKVLFEEGNFDQKEMKRATYVYIIEKMIDIAELKSGDFNFIGRKIDLDAAVFEPLPPDHVMMEVLRISDELKKELGDENPWNDVYELNMERRDAFDEAKRIGIKSPAIKLVLLVDGRKTLVDLATKATLTRLDALKTVKSLLAANVIQKKEVKEEEPAEDIGFEKKRSFSFFVVLALTLFLFTGIIYGRIASRKLEKNIIKFDGSTSWKITIARDRIKNALEIYRMRNGSYPESINQLIEDKIINRGELTFDPMKIYYKRVGNSGYTFFIPLK